MVVVAAISSASALVITAVACGGSSSSDVTTSPPREGGTSSETSAAETPYTLDDVCERTAPLICEIRKPCCESGVGYNETACLAQAKADCAKDVADARGGRMTFFGDRIPGCIPKYKEVFTQCTLTFDLLQKSARTLAACQAFEGQLAEGASCERTSQCKPSGSKDEIVGCDDDTKRCKYTRIAPEGGECALGAGFAVLCDDGLYCDADFTTAPFPGTCKKKTALGGACDKDKKPVPLECGLGNYCDPTGSGTCIVGKSGSAVCGNDIECASVTCTKPDGGVSSGACAPLKSLVKVEECKGP